MFTHSGVRLKRASFEVAPAAMREDRSGGFQGIIGELQKSVDCLSDPLLAEAVSGPFDFDLGDLCKDDGRPQAYLMVPPEFLELWAPVLKAIFVGCMVEKSKRPNAPRQLWVLDKCGQLGRFPVIPEMFTCGAGISTWFSQSVALRRPSRRVSSG